MRKIIVIDDERTFKGFDARYIRNSNEGVAFLANEWVKEVSSYPEPIDELWLDHDLGEEDTIKPVVDLLATICWIDSMSPIQIKQIYVHSMNSPAADKIVKDLSTWYNIIRVPLPECE